MSISSLWDLFYAMSPHLMERSAPQPTYRYRWESPNPTLERKDIPRVVENLLDALEPFNPSFTLHTSTNAPGSFSRAFCFLRSASGGEDGLCVVYRSS